MPRSSARLIAKASGSGSNAAAASSSAQPNNINIPLSNPELDKQLKWKRHKLEGLDPKHFPRFPTFHELQRTDMLLNEDEVKAYRESLRGPPIQSDALQVYGPNLFSWFEDVYNSIIETRYARVFDGSWLVDRNRATGDYYYGPKFVLAISSKLVMRIIGASQSGFMQSNVDAQKPSVENISPHQRHRELCLVLLFEKSIAEELLRGDEQMRVNLLAGPASYALSKPEVRNSWVAGILEASRAAGNTHSPVLPTPPRNSSIPAYPPFDEALRTLPDPRMWLKLGQDYFSSINEHFPLKPEPRLDWLKENKLYLVIKLYNAIRSVSDIRSREDGTNGAHFIDEVGQGLSPRTSAKEIQDACWTIAKAFLNCVENGFVKPLMPNCRDERPLPAGSEDLAWNKRFVLMLTMLRKRKALCWRLVKGSRGLDCFITQPFFYRNLGICDADPAAAAFHSDDAAMMNYNSILFEEGIAL